MADVSELYEGLSEEVGTVLVGNDDVVEGLTVALLTRGHVLLEGVPGVAKTTIANLFARATGLDYKRIQMTPDVLPADITGTTVYRQQAGEFEIQRGPIFANVVVADEINRATPKTQSALLEAMEEEQVTIEGETLSLPSPFVLIATQNPIEMEGTFDLPKALRDRFQFKFPVDIPTEDVEFEMLDRFDADPDLGPAKVAQVASPAEIEAARVTVTEMYVGEKLKRYILALVAATREHPAVAYGASPRASLALLQAGKARAAIHGRDYVIPDDIKQLARPALAHRLSLGPDATFGDTDAETVVADVLKEVDPPSGPSGVTPTEAAPDGGASADE